MLPLGNSSDSSFANLWKCILAHIKLSSWTSDRYISSLLKFICMKIYLQWDMFMNLGSFWDETLRCILNLHKIVFTTLFWICFQWVNIPWAEHYTLDPVKFYSAFAYGVLLCVCLWCAHLSNLEVHQVLPHLPLLSIHGLFIQTQKCLHIVLLPDLGIIYRGLGSLNSLIFGRGNPL